MLLAAETEALGASALRITRRGVRLAFDSYAQPSFPHSNSDVVKALVFWSAAALLIFGELMILRAWWAGRTPAAAGARRPRASEFAWIALPALILAATLAATWRAQRPMPNQHVDIHAEHSS